MPFRVIPFTDASYECRKAGIAASAHGGSASEAAVSCSPLSLLTLSRYSGGFCIAAQRIFTLLMLHSTEEVQNALQDRIFNLCTDVTTASNPLVASLCLLNFMMCQEVECLLCENKRKMTWRMWSTLQTKFLASIGLFVNPSRLFGAFLKHVHLVVSPKRSSNSNSSSSSSNGGLTLPVSCRLGATSYP